MHTPQAMRSGRYPGALRLPGLQGQEVPTLGEKASSMAHHVPAEPLKAPTSTKKASGTALIPTTRGEKSVAVDAGSVARDA